MATLIGKFVNSTWSSNANWTDSGTGSAATPADGDTLIAFSSGVSTITGSDESGTELDRIVFADRFTASIGTSGARLKLRADRMEWAASPDAAWIDLANTHDYTDLVIDGADNTKITSAARAFVAGDVGKKISITGGTGFTVDVYTIESVAGGAAFLDAAVGTVGSTGGTGWMFLKVYIKKTKATAPDEITTKGLHLRLYGLASCEDLKMDSGVASLEVTTGDDATWQGTIKLAGTLIHLDGVGGVDLATSVTCCSGAVLAPAGASGISSSATIVIEPAATFELHTDPMSFPLTGPIVIVRGGTLLDWDSMVPIGHLAGESGLIDFSKIKQPFDVQLCTMTDADMDIGNGVRQPNFVTPIKWRGTGRLTHAGNINTTIEYVE